MTVEWLLRLFSPSNSIDQNNNNDQNNLNFLTNTKSIPTPVSPARPILSSGTNNNNYYPSDYGADFKERQAILPVFSPDYPAFFILILLVTLTSFALFVLLFLCCLDGKDFGDEEQANFPVLPLPQPEEEEPEPLVKDVATETDPVSFLIVEPSEIEDVVEIENEISPESPPASEPNETQEETVTDDKTDDAKVEKDVGS